MGWKTALYQDVRLRMKAGDVIAFSGKGNFSEIIKWATRAAVSHIGVILQSKLQIDGEPQSGIFNQIIESTSLNGFSEAIISRLSDRLDTYNGEIWWLPLRQDLHAAMDKKKYYDAEDFSRFFCSELVAAALEAAGAVSHINASEVTPRDLCSFTLFENDYYQLTGNRKEIRGDNATNPTGWGE